MLIPRISGIIQRLGRLYCLRLYPNIRKKHKNSIIIPNTQPHIMKTLPKKKECHLVNSLRNIFYQSFIWHPFKDGTPKMCYVPTHFSQTSHANIIAHWHFPRSFPLACALSLHVPCLECPHHIFTPAKILLTLQAFALGSGHETAGFYAQ